MIQWRKIISFDFHHIPKLSIGFKSSRWPKSSSKWEWIISYAHHYWGPKMNASTCKFKPLRLFDKLNNYTCIPSVPEKSLHFWIVCQIKNVKHFRKMFICMDGWRSHLSYDTKTFENNSCLGEQLATFVKGMKIRLRKNWLSILAKREVPQSRNGLWCDELKVLGKSVGGENAKVPRYEVKW